MLNDNPLSFWSGTAVQESTNGEFMKHVPYRGSFQTHTPTEQPHTVGLLASDACRIPKQSLGIH